MNRNVLAVIFIIISVGIFFTVTDKRYQNIKTIKAKNEEYVSAIKSSVELLKKRDILNDAYNSINPDDVSRLNRMVPDTIDNVKLIIDVNNIAARNSLVFKDVTVTQGSENETGGTSASRTSIAPSISTTPTTSASPINGSIRDQKPEVVDISFSVTTSYQKFLALLADIEATLRITTISKISFDAADDNEYDFNVELRTYWLRQ